MIKRYLFILCISWAGSSLTQLFSQQRATAYIFMLEDCVICQSYTPLLNQLYENYHRDVEFILVFPNERSRRDSIEKFIQKYHLKLTYKTDHYKQLSHRYDVKVTPEVVIADSAGNVVYQGGLDDGYAGIGKKRKASQQYLKDALENYLAHKPIHPKTTTAIGCFINYKENE
ncbi:MAG: thioredoxin-like domain-containing protein [Saprospiraceae bacterium]